MDVVISGIVHGYEIVVDLTDHLEPRVRDMQGQGEVGVMLSKGGWKTIDFGPLSSSSDVAPLLVDKVLRDAEASRGRVFRLRQRVDNLLQGRKE